MHLHLFPPGHAIVSKWSPSQLGSVTTKVGDVATQGSLRSVELRRFTLHTIVAMPMQPYVVVAIDHDAASIKIEVLRSAHPSMPSQIVLKANKNTLAELALEDGRPSRHLAVT